MSVAPGNRIRISGLLTGRKINNIAPDAAPMSIFSPFGHFFLKDISVISNFEVKLSRVQLGEGEMRTNDKIRVRIRNYLKTNSSLEGLNVTILR